LQYYYYYLIGLRTTCLDDTEHILIGTIITHTEHKIHGICRTIEEEEEEEEES